MPRYFFLTPVLGGPGAPRYPVTEQRQIIGRSEEAEIALLEPTVSRRHAAIVLRDGEVWMEDLESKHGSFVNSKRVTQAQLKVGDILVFGLSIVLRLEETDEEVPPAMPLRVPGGGAFGPVLAAEGADASPEPPQDGETALHRAIPPDQRQARELIRLRDQLVRASKMAAAGSFCVTLIPDVHRRLSEICSRLRGGAGAAPIDGAGLAADLEPLVAALHRVLEATQVIPHQRPTPTPLADAVRRALEAVTPEAELHRVALKADVPADLAVMADPQRLVVAIAEFLKSAVRSGRTGAPVVAQATRSAETGTLIISNQTLEMSSAGLHRVFDPFVTTDAHWHRLGLGIFEARQVVMSFGGTVTLESSQGLGTAVVIKLPLAPAP